MKKSYSEKDLQRKRIREKSVSEKKSLKRVKEEREEKSCRENVPVGIARHNEQVFYL